MNFPTNSSISGGFIPPDCQFVHVAAENQISGRCEVPIVMRYHETLVSTADNQRLFVRHFQSRATPSGRTLLIAHGASEHGERYRHVAQFFVLRGWNVLIGDHRGHGRSSGVPTHVKAFRQYAHDLEAIRRHFDLVPKTTAILGHSMGGLVTIRHAQLYPQTAAGLVLTSPLLQLKVPIPRRTLALGRVLSVVAPRVRFQSRVDPTHTTRCLDTLERRRTDQLMHRSVTARWFFAMQAGLQSAWKDAGKISTPILILQAGSDEIVDPLAPQLWLERVASRDTAFHSLPQHLHELLNEPDWPETATMIAQWLSNRIAKDSLPVDSPVWPLNALAAESTRQTRQTEALPTADPRGLEFEPRSPV